MIEWDENGYGPTPFLSESEQHITEKGGRHVIG